jgi:hypothetical protein
MFTANLRLRPVREWRIYGRVDDSGVPETGLVKTMTAFVLWLLVLAVGVYLLIALLCPDKF